MLISCELAMKLEICYALPALVERERRNDVTDTSKEAITQILMRRDGVSRQEARASIAECQRRIDVIIDSETRGVAGLEDVDNVLREELGLEPDYLDSFLF